MKKAIIGLLLLVALTLATVLSVYQHRELAAKIEVVKIHDCGHVDFKLTNVGTDIHFSGYDKTYPLSLIDRKINGQWAIDPGPWCGTGLRSLRMEGGESINFTLANNHDRNNWRLVLDLYQENNKPALLTKVLNYFDIYDDYPSIKVSSLELDVALNPDAKCIHVLEDLELEEPPEESGLE